MSTYTRYINNPLVRKDAEDHEKVKGTKTGAVGRPTILPEIMLKYVETLNIVLDAAEAQKQSILTRQNMFSGGGKYAPRCSSYTHKRGKNPDSDHSDHDSEDQLPGYKTRKEAYNRVV
eukprot:12041248-Heterocapsa_arctica.AAC.1